MGKRTTPINVARMRELLDVDPSSSTGLRWKISRSNLVKDGDEAGHLNRERYVTVRVDGKSYKAHRIVWALTHDRDPGRFDVDHEDHDTANNAPENLRLATVSQNMRNRRGATRGSSSRFLGVS